MHNPHRDNPEVRPDDELTQSLDFAEPKSTAPKQLAAVTARAEPGLPNNLGRYQAIRSLGRGGFGEVFLAFDPQLDRNVAIKVPRTERFQTAKDVERFLAEARTAAKLRHEAIVTVHDVIHDRDRFFVVMQYVDGRDLSHLLRHERLGPRRAAEMMVRIADAIQHAHELGFVHRDLKPENILLDPEDLPYVTDFGLAMSERSRQELPPEMVGTLFYMSPEQVRGESHRMDARTDLWSLGVMFYEMLTGRRPFAGAEREEVYQQILTAEPVPLRRREPQVPPELDRICLRCLQKRMSERYASAAAFAEDLRAWLAHSAGGIAESDRTALPTGVIPKGLQAFDEHDAGVFLRLVPGPRERDGLPAAVGVWKRRLEATDPQAVFPVGVMYGPTGCGKTSLLRAGILPRLDTHTAAIFIEAAPDETERRLAAAIARRFPETAARLSLPDRIRALRERASQSGTLKIVLVIDQFEQWLHNWRQGDEAELVRALRQCDGATVQCLLSVRDDFWLPLSRLMRALEIPLAEGQNCGLVDSFDLPHAMAVAAELGRAYNRLTAAPLPLTAAEKQFLQEAIGHLADDGRVYPVRLAVFVEMIKDRAWTLETLSQFGGLEGVGVAFLEETFTSRRAPPQYRAHLEAVRRVLAKLLPEQADIKGGGCLESALREASGYGQRPQDFDELRRVLERELRLITSTGDESEADQPGTERRFQLTHDFLVPSVRQWLNRRQRETRQGRAELALADVTESWHRRTTTGNLPTLLQWLSILLWTPRRRWSERENRLMAAARQYYVRRGAALLCGVLLLALSGWGAWETYQQQRATASVRFLLDRLEVVDLKELPRLIGELQARRPELEGPLRARVADSLTMPARRLRLSLALLPWDETEATYLAQQLVKPTTPVAEVLLLRESLGTDPTRLTRELWQILREANTPAPVRLRAACALARFDPDSPLWDDCAASVVQALLREPQQSSQLWIQALSSAGASLLPHVQQQFPALADPEMIYVAAECLQRWAPAPSEALTEQLVRSDDHAFGPLIQLLGRSRDPAVVALFRRWQELDWKQPAADDATVRQAAPLALALLALGEAKPLEQLAEYSTDPRPRTYLVEALTPRRCSTAMLCEQLERREHVPARHALLLAAARHRFHELPSVEVDRLREIARKLFVEPHPAGLHSAAEWLLRGMGEGGFVDAFQTQTTAAEPEAGVTPRARAAGQTWYVNSNGHTLAILDLPPAGDERARRFAISTMEVSIEQFLRFVPDHDFDASTHTSPRAPATQLLVKMIGGYCQWLNKREGIGPDEYCFPPWDDTASLSLPLPECWRKRGYRLPTAREWEFACRAGSLGPRFFGEEALLGNYAWYLAAAQGKLQAGGQLMPNDFGLFDVYGNAWELCLNPPEPEADTGMAGYVLRGGSVASPTEAINSTFRTRYLDGARGRLFIGFRLARTLEERE